MPDWHNEGKKEREMENVFGGKCENKFSLHKNESWISIPISECVQPRRNQIHKS
jgi:hypothetical protein